MRVSLGTVIFICSCFLVPRRSTSRANPFSKGQNSQAPRFSRRPEILSGEKQTSSSATVVSSLLPHPNSPRAGGDSFHQAVRDEPSMAFHVHRKPSGRRRLDRRRRSQWYGGR